MDHKCLSLENFAGSRETRQVRHLLYERRDDDKLARPPPPLSLAEALGHPRRLLPCVLLPSLPSCSACNVKLGLILPLHPVARYVSLLFIAHHEVTFGLLLGSFHGPVIFPHLSLNRLHEAVGYLLAESFAVADHGSEHRVMAGKDGDIELGEEETVDVAEHATCLLVLLHKQHRRLCQQLFPLSQADGTGRASKPLEGQAGEDADVVGVVAAPGEQVAYELDYSLLNLFSPQQEQ
mmetsp:Transcript_31266/g.100290  ORF Transcript_31266/g.100290 Transcript_31266/m.100290 type:complete len:236 (-) Transcript_31266:540-1247(-)